MLPQFIQRKTAFDIFSRHSMVFSNVQGPPTAVTICGERILGGTYIYILVTF